MFYWNVLFISFRSSIPEIFFIIQLLWLGKWPVAWSCWYGSFNNYWRWAIRWCRCSILRLPLRTIIAVRKALRIVLEYRFCIMLRVIVLFRFSHFPLIIFLMLGLLPMQMTSMINENRLWLRQNQNFRRTQ